MALAVRHDEPIATRQPINVPEHPMTWDDLHISQHTVFEPDVMIVRKSDLGSRYIEGTPLLAVEILSPSTSCAISV